MKYDFTKHSLYMANKVGTPRPVTVDAKVRDMSLFLFNATAGTFIKPLVILLLVNVPNELEENKLSSFHLAGQANGWLPDAIFKNMIYNGMDKILQNTNIRTCAVHI